jgi:LPPG:FO 2-phospho-L-lactate transferase
VIVALAGGVGAARLLSGLVGIVAASDVHVVVNTGDDIVLHGLHISPDVDTIVYTLAGAVNQETGWGLAGETWQAMGALERYGGPTWFRLGDRDLATHLFRTRRLHEGATLSAVTREIAAAWAVGVTLLPMSDDRVETRVTVRNGEGDDVEIGFQDYFVHLRHAVPVSGVRFDGSERATPAPGVIAAIEQATCVIVCPSNPIVSIGPILAVPGVREALEARREDAVAISPIVAGAALKGPADRLMTELGHDASVTGVAELYAPLVSTLVVDTADAALAPKVDATGVRCVVAPSIMHGQAEAAELAAIALAAAGHRRT